MRARARRRRQGSVLPFSATSPAAPPSLWPLFPLLLLFLAAKLISGEEAFAASGGTIDFVYTDSTSRLQMSGWACVIGRSAPPPLHIYADLNF